MSERTASDYGLPNVRDIEAALHLLTDISFGRRPDVAELHETTLNAYAALRALAGSPDHEPEGKYGDWRDDAVDYGL